MQSVIPSLGLSAQLKEDMASIKNAMKEAERKLRLLDEVRALLEECGDDSSMTQLFTSLLEEAAELHFEAQHLSEELGDLEESLGDMLWAADSTSPLSFEGVLS